MPSRRARPYVLRDRRLRRPGARSRHPVSLALRTPHDAVLREGARRVFAGRARGRPFQDSALDRCFCPPPADAGTPDLASGDGDRGGLKAARSCRDARGRAHVHVLARCREAGIANHHHAIYRTLPRRSGGAGAFHHSCARRQSITAAVSVTNKPTLFALPGSTEEVEEGQAFSPKFDAEGLITCVVVDARTGEALMVAHMNAAALAKTIETGDASLYTPSRPTLSRNT